MYVCTYKWLEIGIKFATIHWLAAGSIESMHSHPHLYRNRHIGTKYTREEQQQQRHFFGKTWSKKSLLPFCLFILNRIEKRTSFCCCCCCGCFCCKGVFSLFNLSTLIGGDPPLLLLLLLPLPVVGGEDFERVSFCFFGSAGRFFRMPRIVGWFICVGLIVLLLLGPPLPPVAAAAVALAASVLAMFRVCIPIEVAPNGGIVWRRFEMRWAACCRGCCVRMQCEWRESNPIFSTKSNEIFFAFVCIQIKNKPVVVAAAALGFHGA